MKRIAILKESLQSKGGLEHVTQHLITAFLEKGCAPTLLTAQPELSLPHVTLHHIPKRRPRFFHLLHFNRACNRWLQNNPFDAVLGLERTTRQTHYRAGSGVHRAYLQQRALVDPWAKRASFSLNPLHQSLLHLEKKCFNSPTLQKVFTNSQMVKQEILTYFTTPEERIEVIPNGAPYHAWEKPFQETFQNRSVNKFELLFVGSGYRRKGLLFLINALKFLNIKDLHLSVVGYDKEEAFFRSQAAQLPVTFYGKQKELIPFYQRADCLCIPSLYDPCANVTMEALAMGLFVVSSKFNGAHEQLTEETGLRIEELTNRESVAESLLQALKHPKTAARALKIRESVKESDMSVQLGKIVEGVLR